jgi:hypothetical protein
VMLYTYYFSIPDHIRFRFNWFYSIFSLWTLFFISLIAMQDHLQYVYSRASSSWLFPTTIWKIQGNIWRLHQFNCE